MRYAFSMRITLILLVVPMLGAALAVAPNATRDVAIIAHRGASWDAPEHTFAAWDLALEQGADWIEQDLQLTSDGVLVVFHDDSLDRTARGTSCSGRLRERTLAELRGCEVGSWFNAEYPDRARASYVGAEIPTLDSVLTRYAGRARFYIETKHPDEAPGMEDALLLLLRKHRLVGEESSADTGRVIVQSFSRSSLARLRELAPMIPLVLLIEDPIPADELEGALIEIARYAIGIGPARSLVNARLVAAAHKAGLVVHPYTVNEPATMRWMLSLGVDGMFTDRPGELAQLRR